MVVTSGTFNNSISSKDGKTNGFSTGNVSDAKKMYKFAADNNQKNASSAGLEFGCIEYTEGGTSKAAVVTDGKHNKVGASKMAAEIESGGGVVFEISHNHRRSSMPSGYSPAGVPKLDANGKYTGDAINAAKYPNNRMGQPIMRTVYTPKNQTVIGYDKNGISISIGYFGQ